MMEYVLIFVALVAAYTSWSVGRMEKSLRRATETLRMLHAQLTAPEPELDDEAVRHRTL